MKEASKQGKHSTCTCMVIKLSSKTSKQNLNSSTFNIESAVAGNVSIQFLLCELVKR